MKLEENYKRWVLKRQGCYMHFVKNMSPKLVYIEGYTSALASVGKLVILV